MKNYLFFIFITPCLFAASYKSYETPQSLDTHMTPNDAKSTGVEKLTPKERAALQEWINQHHTLKKASKKKAKMPQVSEVLEEGHYIKLSDNTLWKIHPSDTPITSSWITPVEIEVSQTGTGAYPYTLTNTLTKSSVRAQKASALPTYIKKDQKMATPAS